MLIHFITHEKNSHISILIQYIAHYTDKSPFPIRFKTFGCNVEQIELTEKQIFHNF